MKEKKNSAYGYIAITHWLTSTIGMVIFASVAYIILALISQNPIVSMVESIILVPTTMWLAVKCSARYLDRTYLIKDANKIINISTIFIVIIGVGSRIMDFISNGVTSFDDVGIVLAAIVFYLASKKYIKNNI